MEIKKNPKRMKAKNEETELRISDELKNMSPSKPSPTKVATSLIIPMLIGDLLCIIECIYWKPESHYTREPEPQANITPRPEPQANITPKPKPPVKR